MAGNEMITNATDENADVKSSDPSIQELIQESFEESLEEPIAGSHEESLEGLMPEDEEDAPQRNSGDVEVSETITNGEYVGVRLDVFVTSRLPDATRAEAQRLIETPDDEDAGARVNGRRMKANYRLRAGDAVRVQRPTPALARIEAENIPLTIVYEDADMLVIDKPRGMVVHPAPGAVRGTLVNAVLGCVSDLSGVGGEQRPGIVHRLDKDTGGLIMVAKNDIAHRALQAQIQARTASRRYLALVWGVPAWERAQVDAPIGRHVSDRKKMAVVTDARHTARHALTELTRRETFGAAFALLEAKLQTGRTHQIRVHGAYIHHPIVGDPLYGGIRKIAGAAFAPSLRARLEQDIEALHGQALHAYALSFDQPRTGVRLHFEVPLPPSMQTLLDHLRQSSSEELGQ